MRPGPGPSDSPRARAGPENDVTHATPTFMTWNLLHIAQMLKDADGIRVYGD